MLFRVRLAYAGFELTTLMMIGTDCIGSYKSNYLTITNMTLKCITDCLKIVEDLFPSQSESKVRYISFLFNVKHIQILLRYCKCLICIIIRNHECRYAILSFTSN